MSPTADSLLKSALSLPEAERVAIADALLSSLPDDEVDADEEAFLKELHRRSEEMDNDPSASIAWEDLKDQL